ncbi:ABC transporter permease subunit [uncultured Rhodoblastus sp.]|uniref:ABC transporter permease subunit n=1 Tax=uncultured Rhodoblastus sp. TaxID=543037 RepID=UPI0025FCD52C|nr:ABC transporter permease subunit [uncultured Rhodoblastus sp.]
MSDAAGIASPDAATAPAQPEARELSPTRPFGFRNAIARAPLGWLAPAVALVVWQASSAFGALGDDVMPSPLAVLQAGVRLTLSGALFVHGAVSGARALAGLLVGGLLGIGFGLANGLSRTSEELSNSTLQMIRNVPHLALIPLVILWFGIGESAKLFLVALGVFFPIYINTLHGVKTVDPQLLEMGRTYGLDNKALFREVIFPAALPSIFVGLRFALGVMWLTLIVAETISAQSGIGYMAMQAREFMQLDVVVLAILIYALLGKLADVVTRALERRMLRWHPAFQAAAP